MPLDNSSQFIQGLLDVGDEVDNCSTGFASLSSNLHIVRLIHWFLIRYEDLEKRGEILIDCFQKGTGISIIEHFLQSHENEKNEPSRGFFFTDSNFESLKNMFVEKLNNLSENNSDELINNKHLCSYLYRWTRWGNEEEVKSWLESQIKTPIKSIALLKSFLGQSTSQGMGDYVAKVTHYIKLEELEKFASIENIQEALKKLDGSILSDKEIIALDAFNRAIDNREKGISSSEW